ncbi:MAG: histidine kinase N-terminal 7TM domain-containing protein [Halobacteriales archaeon]
MTGAPAAIGTWALQVTPLNTTDPASIALGVLAVLVLLSTYPYGATAIEYRHRDNGLAYLFMLLNVGVWCALFAAQLLAETTLVAGFFYSLSMVGALLASLGWFLFAATASSTPTLPRHRSIFGIVAVLVGADIALVVTSPIHELMWTISEPAGAHSGFAVVNPHLGYWFHIQLLVLLVAGGAILFAIAWERGVNQRYSSAYVITAGALIGGLVLSAVLVPGGFSVAPVLAGGLTTIAWVQANRGRVLLRLRRLLPRTR